MDMFAESVTVTRIAMNLMSCRSAELTVAGVFIVQHRRYLKKVHTSLCSQMYFAYAEIFVNGSQIDRVEALTEEEYETKAFEISDALKADIRILLYADTEDERGAGIAGRVEMRIAKKEAF